MLLTLDIGNTAVSWGVFTGARLRRNGRCRTEAEIATLLATIPPPEAIVAATVAPRRAKRILAMVRRQTRVIPLVAGRDFSIPIKNLTRFPERVGHDRLLAALAAFACTRTATIVVDAGTAITVDYVDARGRFHGGAILPGAAISARALHRETEALPLVAVQKPHHAIGRDTREAIQSGLYWGTVGAVAGLIARIKRQVGSARILVTGGDGKWLALELGLTRSYIPHLTLEGLRLACEHQMPSEQLHAPLPQRCRSSRAISS